MQIIWGFVYLLVFDKYYRNIFYYRIGKYKYFISFLGKGFPSFIIGTYTKIGKGILAVHPFSSIINAKSIGEIFTIKNNVTIGNNKGGTPKIGNNVTINVNAVVVGNISIGNNVMIGACSFIKDDVPDNCIVVGNPAIVIKKDGIACKIKLSEIKSSLNK